jgi:hypothetical protein
MVVAVPVKYFSTKATRQADRVENLRAAIGLVGRDAHLGHDLEDALADGLDVVLFDTSLAEAAALGARGFPPAFRSDIGVDRFRAIARQHAEVMHFARFAGFDDQAGLHAQALTDKVMMHRRRRQQRRHRDAVRP